MPSKFLKDVRLVLPSIVQRVQELTTSPVFTGQLALTIAIEGLRLPRLELPLRYNYPDTPCYDDTYPKELQNIVFYHLLGLKTQLRDFCRVRHFVNQTGGPSNHAAARTVLRAIFGSRLTEDEIL